MTFSHPQMLLGLAALAIPVLVHLLGRKRARRVVLPTAQFADGARQSVRGSRWLRRFVLLALRMAAVALAVLALAEPRFGAASAGATGPAASDPWIVCLDTSPTMMTVEGGRTRLDKARASVRDFLGALGPGERVVLVRSDGKPFDGPPERIRETLAAPAQPPRFLGNVPLGAMLDRGLSAVRPGGGRPRILIVTDASAGATRDLAPGKFRDVAADVVIVPVGGPVENGRLGLPRVVASQAVLETVLSVEVDVFPADTQAANEVHLQVADGSEAPACRVGPGEGVAKFRVTVKGAGPWQGRVWTAPDTLPIDDERFFTAVVSTPIDVLVVDAARAENDSPRSADFVAAAFAGEDPVARKRCARATVAQVNEDALKGVDAVFWVGPDALPRADPVEKFLVNGGGLIWMAADSAPPAPALAALLGADFSAAEDVADGATLDPGGYLSDLLKAFEGGSSGDLRRPVFKRRFPLKLRDGAGGVDFLDGRHAMVFQARGKGRTVTLAFGPGRAWGDLATRPEFVVLAHSLVEGVVPRPTTRDLNRLVGGRTGGPRLAQASAQAPGNYAGEAGQAYSLNISPDETADLVPHVDRVKGAFAADHVKIVAPAKEPPAEPSPRRPGPDTMAWLAAALVLAVAAEALVAGRLSMRS